MFRAGLYARVSTNDQQTIPLQIRALREYAVRRGWTIALQVKEIGSGASQRREKLLDAARRREIDLVLVWRLDRWGRSVADLLATFQELDHLGVGFVSLTAALDAARRREIDLVLVWRLDRWGRSVADLLATFQELDHLGVGFVSLNEALDLTTPAGRAMAGLLAVFAEFEREILRERVRT